MLASISLSVLHNNYKQNKTEAMESKSWAWNLAISQYFSVHFHQNFSLYSSTTCSLLVFFTFCISD